MAASATFALKAGVWFRRGRRFIVSPDSLGTACPQSGRNSTYRPVQISGASSNTCIDSTVRYAAELGYDVTLVKDAIASYQWEEMRATLEINLPNYATAILSAADTIAALEHTTV